MSKLSIRVYDSNVTKKSFCLTPAISDWWRVAQISARKLTLERDRLPPWIG